MTAGPAAARRSEFSGIGDRLGAATAPAGLWYATAALAVFATLIYAGDSPGGALGGLAVLLSFAALAIFVTSRSRGTGRVALDPLTLLAIVFVVWHFGYWAEYYLGVSSLFRDFEFLRLAPTGNM